MNGMIKNISDLGVLAVDDNLQARGLIQIMLKTIGVNQVFMAKDGKEALEFLDDCDEMINVIMCDWNMPRVTGLEVLRQVRTVDSDIPFMMVTGAADQNSVAIAKADGVSSYLTKPYSTDDLEKKLRQVVRILKVRQTS